MRKMKIFLSSFYNFSRSWTRVNKHHTSSKTLKYSVDSMVTWSPSTSRSESLLHSISVPSVIIHLVRRPLSNAVPFHHFVICWLTVSQMYELLQPEPSHPCPSTKKEKFKSTTLTNWTKSSNCWATRANKRESILSSWSAMLENIHLPRRSLRNAFQSSMKWSRRKRTTLHWSPNMPSKPSMLLPGFPEL